MLIPKYWAEAREQHHFPPGQKPRQISLHRFGWSDASQEEAEKHAQERVRQAMQEVLEGKTDPATVKRYERKAAYNGADGIPIREEVVCKAAEGVITRNAYGALCLNTPDVMFVDIDPPEGGALLPFLASVVVFFAIFVPLGKYFLHQAEPNGMMNFILFLLAFPVSLFIAIWFNRTWGRYASRQSATKVHHQIDLFAERNPHWLFNVYRTAAGFRLLFLHRTFDPSDEAVWMQLKNVSPDPVYVRMCRLQGCFRARLTPKPWRIGIKAHIKPRRRAWDISLSQLPERLAWIAQYEAASPDYAVCLLIRQHGQGTPDPAAERVRQLHDEYCKVQSGLPLA